MVYGNKEKRDSTVDLYFIMIYLIILQMILAIVVIDDFEYKAFDMIVTFFNVIVSEDIDIFVKQLKGFKDGIRRVYKLYRVLYRFRKSLR